MLRQRIHKSSTETKPTKTEAWPDLEANRKPDTAVLSVFVFFAHILFLVARVV